MVLSNKVGRTKYTGERRKTRNRLPIAVKVFALVYRRMPCATAHAVRTGIIRTRALLLNHFAISQTSCDGAAARADRLDVDVIFDRRAVRSDQLSIVRLVQYDRIPE
ncbi:hypothetical protein [Burkholderia cepacia]|uniref:hypothetical protein n=1 Tax=Burkholderia cepacia TaxID=292 RepID=UPI0012D9E264|nr:hypothetical protein [Burkholderia cepacia]EMD9441399.1 hypothetical protein [Burkholderia cepacia]NTX22354.1 hypothetical protein [Burkholderia cepacia]